MLVLLDNTRSNGECPYLPDQNWASRTLWVESMTSEEYRLLLDRGYRRSGRMVYQPRCGTCHECRATRVLAHAFRPSKSERRCLARNADLSVTRAPTGYSDERLELHNRYCQERHGRDSNNTMDEGEYRFFMVESPVPTFELQYWHADGRLAGIALIDDLGAAWSSVFTYYDPTEPKRGLGTWSILQTLLHAQEAGVRYVHLGFYVAGCKAMSYKTRFRPAEMLTPRGDWVPVEEALSPVAAGRKGSGTP